MSTPLEVGDPITVWTQRAQRNGDISYEFCEVLFAGYDNGWITFRLQTSKTPSSVLLMPSQEGVKWARGWDTPAADALRTVVGVMVANERA